MLQRLMIFGLLLAFGSVALVPAMAQEQNRADNWWNESVWYLLFVRSFYDSDGDGIGDIQGIIERLDYLNDGDPETTDDLGITGIWLLPIAENTAYHGYHTTDYRSIEADYGTQEDFLQLMDEAHARGIRIVVDFVLNHSGREHPWFQAALAGDEAYEDWYIFADENPGYNGPWGARAWWPINQGERFYYGIFASDVPDLNHNNPDVTAEMYDIARFWLEEMNVDGFRVDAAKYYIETEVDGRPILEDSPANRAYVGALTDFVHDVNPDALVVGEIFDTTPVVNRYTDEDVLDMAFEFDLAEAIIDTARLGNKRQIENQMNIVLRNYDPGEIATFSTNHDKTRTLTQLDGDVMDNRIVANLLLTLPGAPFLYYGDEIGMVGSASPDDINVRTPMQWDDTPQTGGFTTGTPWLALSEGFAERTVAGQTDDPDSLLSHYRNLIHLRNSEPALQTGLTTLVESDYKSAFAYLRYTEDDTLLVLHNTDDRESREYMLMLEESHLSNVENIDLIWSTEATAPETIPPPEVDENGGFTGWAPVAFPLPPYSLYVFRLS